MSHKFQSNESASGVAGEPTSFDFSGRSNVHSCSNRKSVLSQDKRAASFWGGAPHRHFQELEKASLALPAVKVCAVFLAVPACEQQSCGLEVGTYTEMNILC